MDERSRKNLIGLHPDAVRLAELVFADAFIANQIVIIDGLRTAQEQEEYVKAGKSKTMNSRHLTGHAWDFAVLLNGKVTWVESYYKPIGARIKQIAKQAKIPISWGGDWGWDWGHIELAWAHYPVGEKPIKTEDNSTTIAAAGGISLVTLAQQILTYLGDIKGEWPSYVALAVVLVLAGWIIHERVVKARRQGV